MPETTSTEQSLETLSGQLRDQAARLHTRSETAFILRGAVAWHGTRRALDHAERTSGTLFASDALASGNERAEALWQLAEDLHGFARQLEGVREDLREVSKRPGKPIDVQAEESEKELRDVSKALRGAWQLAGVLCEAEKRTHAAEFLRQRKRSAEGNARVHACDVLLEAESPYPVKMLRALTDDLFDDFQWTEELADRTQALTGAVQE